MTRWFAWFRDPAQRRTRLMTASAILIAAGLTAEHLLKLKPAGDGLLLAAALLAGAEIAGRALVDLRRRQISIELLVTIATAGALVIGEYWEAAAVTFLFIFGAFLEARTLSRTRQALRHLLDLAPVTAIVLRDGRQVTVAPEAVLAGESVLIKPGSQIPVDGEVLSGHANVDESAITGEPLPKEKRAGARVFAGTVAQNGLLTVRATGVGADTTLARIIRRVEEAQEAKAPAQRFIERFARWYTPAILGLSGLAYLLTRDLDLALTLLVIGCPGALVISTPVSVMAGIGRAAQLGILVKGGEHLEAAGRITALALDKTGTLTQGRPRLTDVVTLNGAPEAEVLRWAASAEAGSEHPLARPILAAAETLGPLPAAEAFEAPTGRGIRVEVDGHEVGVGSPALMTELGVPLGAEAQAALERLQSEGKTTAVVALDGVAVGVLGIADALRESAAAAVHRWRAAGVQRLVMLTGDDPRAAAAIARQAGIAEVHAGLLPDDKLAWIRRLQAEGGRVAMLGDGINDAPALAAADVGIAMGAAGTAVAVETADIALMADDLGRVADAIQLSRATLANIRQNVAVALVTVTTLLAGVLLGQVHMAGGMLIHELSVLVVIVNAIRLTNWGRRRPGAVHTAPGRPETVATPAR